MKRPVALLILAFLAAACYPPSIASTPAAGPTQRPALAATVVALSRGEVRKSLPSPDGRWKIDLLVYPCVQTEQGRAALEELQLVDLTSNEEGVFAHQLYLCEALGAYGLDALLWSANGRYFYYTDSREGGPDGACGPWLPPILRADPLTLATEKLEGAVASSHQNRIVGWQGPQVVMWDIEAGELGRLKPRAPWTNAQFAWSPDGGAFAYLQSEHPCPPYGRSTVTAVTMDGLTQVALLDSDRGFGSLRWEEPAALMLTDAEGQGWRLDVATGEMR